MTQLAFRHYGHYASLEQRNHS